jgi:hypothetical protein
LIRTAGLPFLRFQKQLLDIHGNRRANSIEGEKIFAGRPFACVSFDLSRFVATAKQSFGHFHRAERRQASKFFRVWSTCSSMADQVLMRVVTDCHKTFQSVAASSLTAGRFQNERIRRIEMFFR